MDILSALCVLFSFMTVAADVTNNPIPLTWENMCTAAVDPYILGIYVDNVTSENYVLRMQCNVTENDGSRWRFQILRDRLQEIRDVFIFLQVTCSNQGTISLPWPMKANMLVGLVVSNCILTEKYADFDNPVISDMPDQLRVLKIRNSVWLSDGSGFDKITSPENLASLTSDYDCGQDSTIEYLVSSNVSDTLVLPTEELVPSSTENVKQKNLDLDLMNVRNSKDANVHSETPDPKSGDNSSQARNTGFGLHQTTQSAPTNTRDPDLQNVTKSAEHEFMALLLSLKALDLKCHYEKLKYIDESSPQLLPIHHFQVMVQGASYPELRVMNYSRSGILVLPQVLQDFRIHFPKLEYLDLSWNYLKKIRLPIYPSEAGWSFLILDARSNLITNISVDDVIAWAKVEAVFIDVRDNPIHCGCEMRFFLQEIQSDEFFTGNLQRYSYIKDLECMSPPEFKGQTLSKVSLHCGIDNHAPASTPLPNGPISEESSGIIIGCFVAVVLIVVSALVAVVVVIRCSGQENFKKSTTNDSQKVPPEKDIEAVFSDHKTKT